MQPIIDEYSRDVEIEEVGGNCGDVPTTQSDQISEARNLSIPPPPYAALAMPASRAALIAVLDGNGYLIPVYTAADFLRGCRYFWSASQD